MLGDGTANHLELMSERILKQLALAFDEKYMPSGMKEEVAEAIATNDSLKALIGGWIDVVEAMAGRGSLIISAQDDFGATVQKTGRYEDDINMESEAEKQDETTGGAKDKGTEVAMDIVKKQKDPAPAAKDTKKATDKMDRAPDFADLATQLGVAWAKLQCIRPRLHERIGRTLLALFAMLP